MSEKAQWYERIPWFVWYLLVIGGLWFTAWSTVDKFDQVLFNPVTTASIVGLLLPLIVVATFIERAVEVYVNTSREPRKKDLEREAEDGEDGAKEKLEKYKSATRREAFLASLTLGTVIAIIGVRVLYPLTNFDHELEGSQGQWFGLIDIVLTGALLSGGAEPIHKLMSIVTGYLDLWRPEEK